MISSSHLIIISFKHDDVMPLSKLELQEYTRQYSTFHTAPS